MNPAPHMTPDEFRRHGTAVIEWIATYMETVEDYPVQARTEPGALRAALPDRPPEQGENFDDILADVERLILPGVTHWQSPSFFGYFPANVSGPAILGELLSAGMGVNGMLWTTSPACTELEAHVLDWVVDLMDLPARFHSSGPGGGVIQDSASSASLCALLAARHRTDAPLDQLRAYTSNQAHSSIEKGAGIAGLAPDQLRVIDVDATFAMRADALRAAVDADIADGLTPFLVTATSGTTSSTAFDPVAAIAEICEPAGAWLHVDAAFAGSAAVCPELRFVNEGVERADSYCFNPHKWLLTNFDCTCFYVADRAPLIDALSVVPEYLRNAASEAGEVTDYRDWQIPLGRRFRALKLWFVLRAYGAEGLRRHVAGHVDLARRFAEWVDDDPRFERAAPTPLSLVCFRHVGGEETNQQILDEANASGELLLNHTRLDDKLTLRLAIGQPHTDAGHVEAAWEKLRSLA